jgi:hypothetical protein
MKKNRSAFKTILLCGAAAIALVVATSCANPVADLLNAKSWGMLGTWGNSSYVAGPSVTRAGFLYLNTDNTFRFTDPFGGAGGAGTYVVDSVAVSGTTRTYQITFDQTTGAPTGVYYVLARVTDGDTYESVSGSFSYPASITIGDPSYGILALQ